MKFNDVYANSYVLGSMYPTWTCLL